MTMKFEEVDITVTKPACCGWFNMTAGCLPRAMGRVWFNGKDFEFQDAQFNFSDLLNQGAKIYWLRATNK
jgi:hypothetical protein